MRLKLKLTLAISLIFVLFSFVTGYCAIRFFGDAHKQSLRHDLVLLATTLATDIDGRLAIAQNALAAVAINCPADAWSNPALAQEFLEQRVTLHSLFRHEIQLLDKEGRLVAEYPFRAGNRGRSFLDNAYVRQTLSDGHSHTLPLSTDGSGKPGLEVMVTAAIIDASGHTIGLLAGRIDPLGQSLHANLLSATLGNEGHLHVVGRDRSFYYHHDATSAAACATENNSPLATGGHPLLEQAIKEGVAAGDTANCCAEPVIAAFRTLQRADWLVGVCFPTTAVYGLLLTAQRYYAVISLLGLVLLLGAVWLVAGRITGPLASLADHVKKLPLLAADKKHLPCERSDEIGTLVQAFNDMVTEVEEQKAALRAAATLATNEQARTEAIIAAVGDGVSIQDRSFRVLYQNEVHQQLVGSHLGAFCYQVYEGMDRVCTGCPVAKAYVDGEIHRAERSIVKDGRMQIVDITASPLRNAAGEIVAGIEVVRNVTDRKQTEEEIQQLNRSLLERATELENLNREQQAFSYSLSHDLKNPLAAISASVDILEGEYAHSLDETGRFVVSAISRSCGRLEEIIDAMLLLTCVNRSELRQETVDLSAVAREVASILENGTPGRQVEWQIADGIVVRGDARLLRSVLENLLGNAWKYTARAGVARIAFGMQTDPAGSRSYWVRDNGVGFDIALVENLFQPFQRLHGDKEFSGLGIGLATVQKIVQRHGGRIWAEGAVDQGAVFYFTLA